MITRRGGDFFWLQCDSCKHEFLQLTQFRPGKIFEDRARADELATTLGASRGWLAGPEKRVHVGPACVGVLQLPKAVASA